MFNSRSITSQEDRFRQSLTVVPVHNAAATILPATHPDELEVEIALTYPGLIMKALQNVFTLRKKKCYVLEGIAKQVFTSIDGKKTFEAIIDEFAAREKLSFFESRALLGQYFQTLARRGLIVATLPREP